MFFCHFTSFLSGFLVKWSLLFKLSLTEFFELTLLNITIFIILFFESEIK